MAEIDATLGEAATAKAGFSATDTIGRRFQYSFAPGERGDVFISPSLAAHRMEKGVATPPEAADRNLFFDVELVSIEDTGL